VHEFYGVVKVFITMIILDVACYAELLERHRSENGKGGTVQFHDGLRLWILKRKLYWTRKASPIAPILRTNAPRD
jgi:hypothetical protein